MRTWLIAALQSLGIPLTTGLFIGLVCGRLLSDSLVPEWPELYMDASSVPDILLAALPGMLLFTLTVGWLRTRWVRLGSFAVLTFASAFLVCGLYATAFGNTWTPREVLFELLLAHLPLLGLALIPGLAWLLALQKAT